MNEDGYPVVKVRLGAGRSVEVRQEFTLPGEWYFERASRLESRGPFQRPATKVWLCTGLGWYE